VKSKKEKTNQGDKQAKRGRRRRLAEFWDGRDEMNLAEWSLCYPNESVPAHVNRLKREDEIYDELTKQYIRRSVVVVGNVEHGLLTPKDIDVLNALIQLSSEEKHRDRKLYFLRRDLIDCTF
jgi:hypothetical protein